ncbi:hypothetical protein [Paenibacillus xylanexedens]|uniref:hypothetical protein n=1 Tax=Paenibacillus xylanexedens TaxID=528191 RepID=UPI000F54B7A7|nr:hypothetical protein [Paenibacillus xylanexedens]
MNLELVEVSTYDEAMYAIFSGENADKLNLTKDKIYQLHKEVSTYTQSDDFYVVNDQGRNSFTGLMFCKRKLYNNKIILE